MSIRITYDTKSDVFRQNFDATASAFARAVTAASKRTATEIEEAGKRQIASAGLGNKFQQSFHATVTTPGGAISNAVIYVSSDIPFFGVFDKGATIRGKPIMWVPLSFGSKVRISQYKGKLALVNRIGQKPLLIDVKTHIPQFVGLDVVQIKKRLDINSIIQTALKQLPEFIKDELRKINGK